MAAFFVRRRFSSRSCPNPLFLCRFSFPSCPNPLFLLRVPLIPSDPSAFGFFLRRDRRAHRVAPRADLAAGVGPAGEVRGDLAAVARVKVALDFGAADEREERGLV